LSTSVLVLLNRASGTGHAESLAGELAEAIRAGYGGPLDVSSKVVDTHPAARSAAAAFVADQRPSLVAAAGGGGTLRAVVEGVMDAFPLAPPPPDAVLLAGLRMGSGNVVARNLDIPQDPLVAARQIGAELRKGSVRRCSVIRCMHGTPAGGTAVRHAVTMCGLGQWGRVPGDITRWRARHSVARRRAASWVGLERVNLLEYLGFGAARLLAGTVAASQCDLVEIDGSRRLRLLAAVALNMPLPPLPDPGVTMSDEAVGLIVVPRLGRPFRRRLVPGAHFDVRLLDRDSVEFFLDEDPERATGWLRLAVAGCLSFVPGTSAAPTS
jgi:Diacylglycerol kinase catalytic domain